MTVFLFCFVFPLSCLFLLTDATPAIEKPDLHMHSPTYLGQSLSTRSTLSQPASCVIIVFGWQCWTGAEIHQVLVNLPWVTTAGWPEENDYEIKLLCLSNKDYWYVGQDRANVNLFLYTKAPYGVKEKELFLESFLYFIFCVVLSSHPYLISHQTWMFITLHSVKRILTLGCFPNRPN